MQVRNQRRTLQYPRGAVLLQMLGQGSGPQEKDDGTAGYGTVGKYGSPFRIIAIYDPRLPFQRHRRF